MLVVRSTRRPSSSKRFEKLPRDRRRVFGPAHLGKKDDELVPTHARDRVSVAHALEEPPCHFPENGVSDVVAEPVVDRAKEVEVQKENAEPLRAVARLLQAERQPLHEQRAVRETRERIVEGLERDHLLRAFRVGDVTGNRRDARQLAVLVPDRRDRDGDLERSPVLVAADRFVAHDPLAGANALEHLTDFARSLFRLQDGDLLAFHIRGRIAVHLRRAGVPARDIAVRRRGNHGVMRRLEDRRHAVQREFPAAPVADVHRHRADEPHARLSLERKAEDEPVARPRGAREGLLDLEHGAGRENHLVVAADPLGVCRGEPLMIALAEQGLSLGREDVGERPVVIDETAGLVLQELEGRTVVAKQQGGRLRDGERSGRELPRRKNAARDRVISVFRAVSPSGEPGLQRLSRHRTS
jgi:hypothetical protein